MKKSIPLKEIVGFLPYDLKIQHKYIKAKHGEEKKSRSWVSTLEPLNIQIIERFNDWLPIVRPLSDLIKEITHNGENFVPLVKYMTEWFGEPCEDFNELEMCDIELSFLDHLKFYEMRTQQELEFLYEHQFDVFDWIKDGLAIDINTL